MSVARKDDEPESLIGHSILQIPLTRTLNEGAASDSQLAGGTAVTPTGSLLLSGYCPTRCRTRKGPFVGVYDPTVGTLGAFHGHLARPNTQWSHTAHPALVVLRGEDAYEALA